MRVGFMDLMNVHGRPVRSHSFSSLFEKNTISKHKDVKRQRQNSSNMEHHKCAVDHSDTTALRGEWHCLLSALTLSC